MIIRFVQVRTEAPDSLRLAYERVVITALRTVEGCISASLLQSSSDPSQCVSMTVWRTSEHARQYEAQGLYQELLEAMRPYIIESAEWRLQLGDDLTVRYEPVAEGPAIQQYAVETGEGAPEVHGRAAYLRVVSHQARPDAVAEFRRIYQNEVVPALRAQTACRDAYLVADPARPATLLSVTLWADQEEARRYELSGQFTNLLAKLEPTLTSVARWKMDVGQNSRTRVVTSDDVSVEGYTLLASARFSG